MLEVMVAMAILATSMVVLLENHGSSIRLSMRSRQVSIAINLAKDLMTELETEGFPELGEAAGDFEDIYPGLYVDYRWEREVAESNFWTYVRECYIRVYYRDGLNEQVVELTQYISAMDSEQQELAEEESSGDDDTSGAVDDVMGGAAGAASAGASAGGSGGESSE